MPAHLKGLSRGPGAVHVTKHVRKWRGEVEATRIRWENWNVLSLFSRRGVCNLESMEGDATSWNGSP